LNGNCGIAFIRKLERDYFMKLVFEVTNVQSEWGSSMSFACYATLGLHGFFLYLNRLEYEYKEEWPIYSNETFK
jgi:hypothetical protein